MSVPAEHRAVPPERTVHPAERRADRVADASLLTAAAAGSLLSVLRIAVGEFGSPFTPAYPFFLLWGAVPAFLILGAYLLTAASERGCGIRQQRGALAALTGLAVLSVPLIGFDNAFSPIYGLALMALALRTRGTLAAAAGVLAVSVSLTLALAGETFTGLQATAAVFLVAVASGIAAVRCRREAAAAELGEGQP